MVAILNIKAGSNSAAEKFEKIKPRIKTFEQVEIYAADRKEIFEEVIVNSIRNGEFQIVALGGDGTVNLLLNLIMKNIPPDEIENVSLGAIGLGSSNDFHKPVILQINGIPYSIDFENVYERDIGYFDYTAHGVIERKYFLINASLGLTALGNYFYNKRSSLVKLISKFNPTISIYYSIVKTLLKFRNIPVSIYQESNEPVNTKLSNLAILKNPHFSADLKYDSTINYDNGLFNFFLCERMNKLEMIKLLISLKKGNVESIYKMSKWTGNSLKILSPVPFFVEYDGEVISTESISFGILNKKLKVCR